MKRFILLMAVVAMISCEKESESFPLTMDGAVAKVEKVMKKYSGCNWYASKNIIEPSTVIQYSFNGKVSEDSPDAVHDYISPDFRSWLVMLDMVKNPNELLGVVQGRLWIFVNVDTGEYEEDWVDGMPVIEWGSDPVSRYMAK